MNAAEYGKALFLLAKEEGLCDKIKTEAEAIGILLSENPKYITLLDTPALPTEEKNPLLDKAFGGFHEYLLNFMKILVSKRAVYLFSRAYSAYCRAYDEENNILHANAVTAIALNDAQSRALRAKLAAITGKNVNLKNTVDPSIVGGVRLQFDGIQLDSSIENQLESLRKTLKQTNL